MSYENAKANLKELGKELNLPELAFDENKTCILGIDNAFSLHLTYEPNSDRLYLYSPILDGLPQKEDVKLKLYEALLEVSLLGGQMFGGGIGVAINEGIILMHCTLEMAGADVSALRRLASLFVDAVDKLRKRVQDILAGRDPGATGIPGSKPPDGMPGHIPSTGMQGDKNGNTDGSSKPGDHFIKI